MSVVVKCDFAGDLRRLALSEGVNFAELQRLLGQCYNIDATELKIRYVDDENDLITMTSDVELVEALNLAKEAQQPLRLVIATAPRVSPAGFKGDCKRSEKPDCEAAKAAWREAWLARKAAFKAACEKHRKHCRQRTAASEGKTADEDKEAKDKAASESESESDGEARCRRRWRKLFKRMMMRPLMGQHHGHRGPRFFGGFGFGPARPPYPPLAKGMWHACSVDVRGSGLNHPSLHGFHGSRRHFGMMGAFRRLHHHRGFCGRFGFGRHGFAHGLKPECPRSRSPSPVGRHELHKARHCRRMLRRRLFKRMMLLAALKKHKHGSFGMRGCRKEGHCLAKGMGMRPHRWGRMFS